MPEKSKQKEKKNMSHLFETKQKYPDQKQYMDFVSRIALPALNQGNVSYVNFLLRIFTIKDAKHYHIMVADAFVWLLSQTSAKALLRLDEQCRRYCSEEYTINWWYIDRCFKLSHERLPYLSVEQYTAILGLGTFHANGYFRQMCMEELAKYSNALPFLAIRLNDWVSEIRQCAYQLTVKRLRVSSIQELFSAMPMLDKVKNSRRRDASHLFSIEMQLQKQLSVKFADCPLHLIHTYDITVKNSIYRFLNKNNVLTLSQMELLCSLEKNSYGKRLLILGIFKHFNCTEQMIFRYLSDKSAIVRYHALDYYYTQRKDVWDGLAHMLMDKSRKIRSTTSYILMKHSDLDVLAYYKEQLQKRDNIIAILGIGENGSGTDIDVISPYFDNNNEHLVKAALQSYGMLAMKQGEAIYWKYLLHPSIMLSRQAYRLIKKYDIHFGAAILYETYLEYQNRPVAEDIILLLAKEPSWSRLPYLLLLYDSESLSNNIKNRVHAAVTVRNMYAAVSAKQEQFILSVLEQQQNHIPEELYKNILFDLSYVVKN